MKGNASIAVPSTTSITIKPIFVLNKYFELYLRLSQLNYFKVSIHMI